MGGIIPNPFSQPKSDSPVIFQPPPPPVLSPPSQAEAVAAGKQERQARGQGRTANVLTSPLGTTENEDQYSTKRKLLGSKG